LSSKVALAPGGPNPAAISVPVGGTVEWLSTLGASPSLADLQSLTENPTLRVLSNFDPMTNIQGFDAGMLAPGQVYRRQFDHVGTYTYSDGVGHTAQVIVTNLVQYLPVLKK
jgi:plastocyanin